MEKVKSILESLIREFYSLNVEVEIGLAPTLETSGEDGFRADIATNAAMKLAGMLKKEGKSDFNNKPVEIAEKLKRGFLEIVENKESELAGVRIAVAGPGFLNFMLPDDYYCEVVQKLCTGFADFVKCEEYKNKNVVAEFSDPNPFKVLHVGHLYTSVVGESISRLLEFAGGRVHRVNFGGDVGLHVAKTIFVLLKDNVEITDIEDIARAYVEGTRAYDEDDDAKVEITQLNKKIYQINKENIREGKIAELYWKGRELSYKYFEQFYEKINVKFEKFYPESSVAERGVLEVQKHTPGVYSRSDGAVIFSGEKFGLHTRVFINSEGLPTYEAKDVGLLFNKYDDYDFDESIVITGNEQTEYMKVVLKSIEQYAPDLVQKTRHLTHGMVRLPGNEKMSSRKGNFIKAADVLEMAPIDAIRYSFLKYRMGGDIEFNAEESVSMTGNSGVYLQYSAVRAKKILRGAKLSEKVNEKGLEEFEMALVKKFIQYPSMLEGAVKELAPYMVCTYLFELAQTFSRFYENCRVVGDGREKLRIKIVYAFYEIMEHGLKLLGIEVPEEM